MPVYRIHDNVNIFPPPELACDDGLLAIGGDLNTERLLNAYSNGIFPWYNPGEAVLWWCPKERFVIFPEKVKVSRSMKKFIKNTAMTVGINTDFERVMRQCQKMREGQTWITEEMKTAYKLLFDREHAMCVSVYIDNTLVGGLYGVVVGKCFFGESMFSKATNASKLALIALCEQLTAEGFLFIDCQFHTPHLESMGGEYLTWQAYKSLLKKGIVL
jgi:leucyl/phenylalanyl-tRNA--protein transferase